MYTMLRGLYTATSGMEMQLMQQKILADNLANINTSGFKSASNTYKTYQDQSVANSASGEDLGSLTRGVAPFGTHFNFEQGALYKSGNPLDLAINGPGFFPVEVGEGEVQYTRSGHFTIDGEGYLVTQQGNKVLDQGFSPVYIWTSGVESVTILRSGEVDVNGKYTASLGVFEFPDATPIIRTTGDKFIPGIEGVSMDKVSKSTIQQGFTESSNVSAIRSASEMVQVTRGYEANQKVVKIGVDTLQMLMDVGRI